MKFHKILLWHFGKIICYYLAPRYIKCKSKNLCIIPNISKVEKILKCSRDLIPSSSLSVKIQMGGKVCLRCKGKTLLGIVNKLLKTKSLSTSSSNVLLANNLNFYWRWRWWDQIQAIFLNLFYFKLWQVIIRLNKNKKYTLSQFLSFSMLITLDCFSGLKEGEGIWVYPRQNTFQQSCTKSSDFLFTRLGTVSKP